MQDASEARRWGKAKPLRSGQQLRQLREEAGISQRAVCERLGIGRGQLSDIERGIQSMSLRRARQFATLLGHSFETVVATLLQEKLEEAGFESLEVRVIRKPEDM